jgi:MerR family transcriptional regulator, heat shock protein HspR
MPMARKRGPDDRRDEDRPDDRAVYIISVAAELAGVHPQTLRIYERIGLLSPARTAGNTRRYSEVDIRRAQLIQQLTRGQGLNLAGVQMILDMEDELERLRRRVERLDRELESAQQRVALEAARLRRESTAGELVPLATVRRMLLRVALPAPDGGPGSGTQPRAAIPLGPASTERDERPADRPSRQVAGERT